MRLAKYGKQLRENYKAFKNKQESVSAKELSAHNESLRSRVAMDFTGNEGRIVEDPKEARDIAISEGVTWKRRLRGNGLGQTRRSGSSAITGTTNSVLHHGQPWFYKSMPREHAATLIGTHGTQDGVFLVRESRSNPGSFVLTLKCATKVIHVPIHPINDPVRDIICYSLDNGVTKFYDLLQLVEFYQLNTGALPTRLSAYLERSRDTNTIKLAGGGGPPDIAGAAASSSSAGGGGGGAATSHSEPGLRCDSIF
ncbi:hypothetical protein O3M35_002221 [Rhynocoris fuscipes]|uniref:SH2 domain-containing protein n=1 Tax=Rhynocoris fuscipes TaxID=488301 RepID=A0AAW1CRS0_9HEMI